MKHEAVCCVGLRSPAGPVRHLISRAVTVGEMKGY